MSLPPTVPNDISSPKAYLIGGCVEGPLLGINIALYIMYVRILSKNLSLPKKLLIGLATVQLVSAFAHYITIMMDLISGFITYVDGPGGADAYFGNTTRARYVIAIFFFSTNYSIGDAILAWRCYAVWGHNRLIGAFFTVLVIVAFICGYTSAAHIATLGKNRDLFADYQWAVAIFAMSLSIQVLASSMVVYKIWRTSISMYHLSAAWIIVESGLILTSATVSVLVLFLLNMQAGQILSCVLTQLSLAVPLSIAIRAASKWANDHKQSLPLSGYTTVAEAGMNSRRGERTIGTGASMGSTIAMASDTEIKVDMSSMDLPSLTA
ncbi:uncharacterized protein PHACADRAFT_206224 [Phanerochaete carnosa HHB-10118-sp]|uniref:Uncharacterized protein n=1 Tax=Phanerochaete carnosa (strain HHB-10118-sp) TaxID=650164 RepID=K5WKR8_PHACS|nr:uncharacterized protein PHACADRAFT_206224 [Phanerochaete carnosa HHB-10118-sp]EKM60010.1 hypothetical protein PHACADRAFT_206224 [Phanerochaete carnosa HHB-10118-sp]